MYFFIYHLYITIIFNNKLKRGRSKLEANLSTSELINVKLARLLTKTDDYLRGKNSGLFKGTAATDGLLFGATALVAGALGYAANHFGLSDVATHTLSTIGGKDINLSQVVGAGGAFVALEFSLLAKVYREVVGNSQQEVPGYLDVVTKKGEELVVSRHEVLKQVEMGTFYQTYEAITVPKGLSYEKIYPTMGNTENIAKMPYYMKAYFDANAAKHTTQDSSKDVEVVRRECFKEAKNDIEANKILSRINGIRDTYNNNVSTKALKLR